MLASPQIKRRVVILALLGFVVFPMSVLFYTHRPNAFAPTVSKLIVFENPSSIQDILPDASYAYIVSQLSNYVSSAFPDTKSVRISSPVTTSDGTYTFQVEFLPSGGTHLLSVRVVNYNSIISTAVYLDNSLVQSDPSSTSKAAYTGFDSLISAGLSSFQTQALQQAFAKFNSTKPVTINTDSIVVGSNPAESSYTFTVSVGGTDYKARVVAGDLTSVQLFLLNKKTGTTVFDSGVIGSQT